MTNFQPMFPKLLPTGVPLDIVSTPSDPLFYVGNLLNTYGVTNAMRIIYTLNDYLTTHSLYSLFELVKLTTKFGTAYCTSALAISLGRDKVKEYASLTLSFPYLNVDNLGTPSLSAIPVFYEDTDKVLADVFAWFGYGSLNSVDVLKDPNHYLDWLVTREPVYAEPFGSLTINPKVFINFVLSKPGMPMTTELAKYIKEAFQ